MELWREKTARQKPRLYSAYRGHGHGKTRDAEGQIRSIADVDFNGPKTEYPALPVKTVIAPTHER